MTMLVSKWYSDGRIVCGRFHCRTFAAIYRPHPNAPPEIRLVSRGWDRDAHGVWRIRPKARLAALTMHSFARDRHGRTRVGYQLHIGDLIACHCCGWIQRLERPRQVQQVSPCERECCVEAVEQNVLCRDTTTQRAGVGG
jgi:rubredoxin